ncbi:MAG: hypothetical protein K2K38_01120 [Clostridia bacterium]|nr:hypothetical protein [Clostridia bacterium]
MRKKLVTFIALALTAVAAPFCFTACGRTADEAALDNKHGVSSAVNSTRSVSGDVLKVVNVTDGSYRLKDGEYSEENGEVTISEAYLKTLEADTKYTFRAVTASADEDFVVETNFEAATITPVLSDNSGFTRGEDISFKVSESVQVFKIEINGIEYAYNIDGDVITLSADTLKNMTGGTHTVKAYTSLGRPTATFKYSGLPDYIDDEEQPANRTFLWVDLAVFGALILGYAGFTAVKKLSANKKG